MILAELLFETMSDRILNAAAHHLLIAVDAGHTSRRAVLISMFEDEFIDTFNDSEIGKPGFRTKLREWCKNSVFAMAYELESKFQNGRLPIWRMITAPVKWKPDPNRHPGVFWSWDHDAAEAHWGGQNDQAKWLLHAEVTTDQIDWPVTISKNCMPDYEDEKEIELKPKVPISILSYERVA